MLLRTRAGVNMPAIFACAWSCCLAVTAAASDEPDYLAHVTAYADAMLEHGQDRYGNTQTPLFVEELDLGTMRMLEGEALETVEAIPREYWGIRPHDRMLGGANPHHCVNLYQILYALTPITGDARHAEAADASLKHFFEHCQSDATGLLYWGEHAGWDLRANAPLETRSGDIHEFYRAWPLWESSWRLAPEPCRRFALGLWEHQIGDHETGDFSRRRYSAPASARRGGHLSRPHGQLAEHFSLRSRSPQRHDAAGKPPLAV